MPRLAGARVVAHVYRYDELSRADLPRRFVQARFNPARVNDACLAPYADKTPTELVELTPPLRETPGTAGRVQGRHPEVRGPGEAILLAIAGRDAAVDELSGPGLATLRSAARPGQPRLRTRYELQRSPVSRW